MAEEIKNNASNTAPAETAKEKAQKFYDREGKLQEMYAEALKSIQLIDLSKTESRTFTIYNKDKLRTFLKNPKSNESNIRNLSRFLYRVSQPYNRLIKHNAQMINLNLYTAIPKIDISKEGKVNSKKVMKNYYATLKKLDKMNLASEAYKWAIIAWREDAFFGYVYEDDDGFFVYPLDGDYCKICSTNSDGTFNFAFDFSYFRQHSENLEYWDDEFRTKYEVYQKSSTARWQELNPERTICLKINNDDPTMCIPPYIAMFEAIIDNVDLESIQKVKDTLSVYKILVAEMETLKGTNRADDWAVNPTLAYQYYEKMQDACPEGVVPVLSPLPVKAIEFKDGDTKEVDMIANSTANLFKKAGGSLILNDDKTGTIISNGHIISDELTALKPILGEIQAWVNRYIKYEIRDAAHIKYLEVGPYTKASARKEMLEAAQYSLPCKLAVCALNGFTPLEALQNEIFENKILNLTTWTPLASSHTQSSDTIGAPKKDDRDLTDAGDRSRDTE